jgi:glycosyltransferase involved in cell wall biosynthesis
MSVREEAFPFTSIAVTHLGGTSSFAEGRVRPLLGYLQARTRTELLIPSVGASVLAPEFPAIAVAPLAQPRRNGSRPALIVNYLCGLLDALRRRVRAECVVGMTGVANDALATFVLARRNGARAVCYVDNLTVRGRPGPWLWTRIDSLAGRFAEWLYPKFDALIVTSPVAKAGLLELGVRPERILESRFGIDEPSYRVVSADPPPRIRHRCTFLGRLNAAKGIFDLLAAWPAILAAVPDASLVVIGSGDAESVAAFKEKAARTPGREAIRLLGYVDGVRKYRELAASEVFLAPTYSEAFGVALREALVFGNRVICYDAPGIRENVGPYVSMGPLGDTADYARRAIEALRSERPPVVPEIEISFEPSLERDFARLGAMFAELRSPAAPSR